MASCGAADPGRPRAGAAVVAITSSQFPEPSRRSEWLRKAAPRAPYPCAMLHSSVRIAEVAVQAARGRSRSRDCGSAVPLTPARPRQTWPPRYSVLRGASPTSSSWTRRPCPSCLPPSACSRCWSEAARVRGSLPPHAARAPRPRSQPQPPVLERLDSNRQQMPEVQAIYFLDPNERSFSRMLQVRRRATGAAARRRRLTTWVRQDFRELEGDVSQVGCCERLLYLGMQLPKVSVRMYKSVHLVTTRRTARSTPVLVSWAQMLRLSPHAPCASADRIPGEASGRERDAPHLPQGAPRAARRLEHPYDRVAWSAGRGRRRAAC